MAAKDRFFTKLAANLMGAEHAQALQEGRCPICKGPIGKFRNALSEKEFAISGMCQSCQDDVFGIEE